MVKTKTRHGVIPLRPPDRRCVLRASVQRRLNRGLASAVVCARRACTAGRPYDGWRAWAPAVACRVCHAGRGVAAQEPALSTQELVRAGAAAQRCAALREPAPLACGVAPTCAGSQPPRRPGKPTAALCSRRWSSRWSSEVRAHAVASPTTRIQGLTHVVPIQSSALC